MKDNTDRLLEAVEYPERFSDDELDMLLKDPETSELYDAMTRYANLLTDTSDPDLDAEWNRFSSEHRKRKDTWSGFFINRKAAAAVAAAVVSFAVVAATIGITKSLRRADSSTYTITEQPTVLEKASSKACEQEDSTEKTGVEEIKVFKDQTFEQIIKDISSFYGVTVSFNSSDSKNLRLYFKWDKTQPLSEVVDQLNSFEHIEIKVKDKVITVE